MSETAVHPFPLKSPLRVLSSLRLDRGLSWARECCSFFSARWRRCILGFTQCRRVISRACSFFGRRRERAGKFRFYPAVICWDGPADQPAGRARHAFSTFEEEDWYHPPAPRRHPAFDRAIADRPLRARDADANRRRPDARLLGGAAGSGTGGDRFRPIRTSIRSSPIPEEVLAREGTIQNPTLPFTLKIRQFMPNSRLVMRSQEPQAPPSPATMGFGKNVVVDGRAAHGEGRRA